MVPSEVYKNVGSESEMSKPPAANLWRAKSVADRLLIWGLILGVVLGGLQIAALPLLQVFSPLPDVQAAARIPSIIGAMLQVLNGAVFIGEGIQQGNQYFGSLAAITFLASAAMLGSLKVFSGSLIGVWGSFAVFNSVRLIGVLLHHFYFGPLAVRNIQKVELLEKKR
jgi:Na+-driven multidrug efflux pump